ncbi:MAG TPA: hypothetical protein VGE72_26945 [Azospirillum sp.]
MTVAETVERLFTPLPRHLLVEAVYLARRLLTHRIERESFLKQLKADTAMPEREQAVGAVLGLVDAMESEAGLSIEKIADDRREPVLQTLGKLFWDRVETKDASPERAEELLRKVRSHWPSAAE